MTNEIVAKFGLGQIVRHREAAFRGVVIDVDPVFAGQPGETGAISPDQPFYQVLALGDEGGFIAYASEDSLEQDPELVAMTRDAEQRWFTVDANGRHAPRSQAIH
ncbi:heat shock protein HspQ [Brevundimonas sp.]|uniref:heat shock protein HspQ n=1 Tax=Brevundimonas sp. TaxID=1871086 RepID=UPI002D249F3B|nr:heat shock protein HspQ [Brevundimonas sp.]HYC96384.1 heat shock protein HspQ [Brevundimonas sp.]